MKISILISKRERYREKDVYLVVLNNYHHLFVALILPTAEKVTLILNYDYTKINQQQRG